MTEQEAKTKPLHEVWERFNAINCRFLKWTPAYVAPIHTFEARLEWEMEVAMLYGVLSERCKRVDDADGWSTRFRFDNRVLVSYYVDKSGNRVASSRNDTIETAKNLSAAYSFWVWELEQRALENPADAGNNPSETA